MPRINDTTKYPNTAPDLADSLPGSDASASDATVTFLLSAILALFKQHMSINLLDDYTGVVLQLGQSNVERWMYVSENRAQFGYDGTRAVVRGGGAKGVSLYVDGISNILAVDIDTEGRVAFGYGIQEGVGTITGTTPAINNTGGTIFTWVLTGNSTPTISLEDGETITLFIEDGSSYVVTWPSTVKWAGGSAPALAITGYTGVVLTQIDGVVYGSGIGDFS